MCNMKVEVEPKQLIEKKTDDRGRLTIGSEYKNQKVKVLIVE